MTNIKIPKRVSTAIINSMTAGVVPRIGLEHIAVGRKKEIETILRDLENISEGAAAFRFIAGRYGSGKSFLLQVIRNYAMDRDFVVADVDLSPEKRLSGSGNQGLATYRELMQRLSTKLRPDGGALEAIFQKWINNIRLNIIQTGVLANDPKINELIESKIIEIITSMEEYAHGFDFANVLSIYYKAYSQGDDELKQASIKWLRGEFATKTEAKASLPVGEIISDDNWYEYIKLFASFIAQVGYQGLVVFVDESVNLYKISNRQSRENNYEKLLSMFNDTMQGKVESLGIYMAGTPQFIEDERRGLYSYAALKSRLADSRFAKDGYIDFNSPIIRLQQLTDEEIFLLLERLTDVHAQHYGYVSSIKDGNIVAFMQIVLGQLGANELLTPREITRDYLGLLNIMQQDPSVTFEQLIHAEGFKVSTLSSSEEHEEADDEFAMFEL
jgi:hypothetical protein